MGGGRVRVEVRRRPLCVNAAGNDPEESRDGAASGHTFWILEVEGTGGPDPGCERGHAEGPNSWSLGKEAPEAWDSWVLRRRALVAWTPGL